MKSCVLCRNKFEADEPAVLFISKYGSARVLCPNCESLLDRATNEEGEPAKKEEARTAVLALADHVRDYEALTVLRGVLDGETSPEETEEDADAAAMWEETRADPAEEEEAAKQEEEAAGIKGYIPLIAAGVVFIAFMLWWFLR